MMKSRTSGILGLGVFGIIFLLALYLFCKVCVIGVFYLGFLLCIVSFSVISFIISCLVKKKCLYVYLLCIIVVCVLSFVVYIICNSQIDSSIKKVTAGGSVVYFEMHSFPQSEIIIKEQTILCFSDNYGKVIVPQGAQIQVFEDNNNFIFEIVDCSETIKYLVDTENKCITEL